MVYREEVSKVKWPEDVSWLGRCGKVRIGRSIQRVTGTPMIDAYYGGYSVAHAYLHSGQWCVVSHFWGRGSRYHAVAMTKDEFVAVIALIDTGQKAVARLCRERGARS
jgi:hypothetical protein